MVINHCNTKESANKWCVLGVKKLVCTDIDRVTLHI